MRKVSMNQHSDIFATHMCNEWLGRRLIVQLRLVLALQRAIQGREVPN